MTYKFAVGEQVVLKANYDGYSDMIGEVHIITRINPKQEFLDGYVIGYHLSINGEQPYWAEEDEIRHLSKLEKALK